MFLKREKNNEENKIKLPQTSSLRALLILYSTLAQCIFSVLNASSSQISMFCFVSVAALDYPPQAHPNHGILLLSISWTSFSSKLSLCSWRYEASHSFFLFFPVTYTWPDFVCFLPITRSLVTLTCPQGVPSSSLHFQRPKSQVTAIQTGNLMRFYAIMKSSVICHSSCPSYGPFFKKRQTHTHTELRNLRHYLRKSLLWESPRMSLYLCVGRSANGHTQGHSAS